MMVKTDGTCADGTCADGGRCADGTWAAAAQTSPGDETRTCADGTCANGGWCTDGTWAAAAQPRPRFVLSVACSGGGNPRTPDNVLVLARRQAQVCVWHRQGRTTQVRGGRGAPPRTPRQRRSATRAPRRVFIEVQGGIDTTLSTDTLSGFAKARERAK